MKRSLNEIEGMALKAARGAGVPLGHAEDFAAAVAFLAATRPAHLGEVIQALAPPHVMPDMTDLEVIAPTRCVMAGPCAIDLMLCGHPRLILRDVDCPALLHAMVAVACHQQGLRVDILHSRRDVTLHQSTEVEILRAPIGPVDVDDDTWAELDRYAQNTYVPATEASRLSGAGAGLTDND